MFFIPTEWFTCNQGDSDYCCTEESPCDVGEGDCDDDDECRGDLVCGEDNCGSDTNFLPGHDCCMRPIPGKVERRFENTLFIG